MSDRAGEIWACTGKYMPEGSCLRIIGEIPDARFEPPEGPLLEVAGINVLGEPFTLSITAGGLKREHRRDKSAEAYMNLGGPRGALPELSPAARAHVDALRKHPAFAEQGRQEALL